ncbi:hypothetical protein Cgig2_024096 [Carnegiea gigantea]|uniref:Uncharacterized protein n=1 Tax=Carnegiea gigantea TaxID=171969 RepID=A0A9Q1GNK5_9CARY|nr:hypothetical protein Cgig2_024096 [Carnegiea gigantea]
MDEEYDEVNVAWLKEWKTDQNARELTRMSKFILAKKDGGESFKRNFAIYLVNYLFSRSKNFYCSKSVLKYVKDVNRIASLDWCQLVLDKLISSHDFDTAVMKEVVADLRSAHLGFAKIQLKQQPDNDDGGPLFSPTLALREPDSEAQILVTTSVADASVSIKKEDHHENVLMDQAKKKMNKNASMLSFSLGLGLSQPDSQSPVPQSTSVPDLSTTREKA